MNEFPKISIVTACYNHEKFIAQTIESVLSQDYPELEYVVIDDGSTDRSWEIIQKYRKQLNYCERLEGHRDIVTFALNHGFSKTSGSIMAWLNSDDILVPKSLFTIADIFHGFPQVKWLTGMATTINHATQRLNSKLVLKNKFDYLTKDWRYIQQESTFWRRELWNQTGGKLSMEAGWAFDTDLWIRFFHAADHFYVNAPIGAFRSSSQSKSVSDSPSYVEPSLRCLNNMKQNAGWSSRVAAVLYRIAESMHPVSGLIPNRAFGWPLLRNFSHPVINYSFEKCTWLIHRANPFRRYYF